MRTIVRTAASIAAIVGFALASANPPPAGAAAVAQPAVEPAAGMFLRAAASYWGQRPDCPGEVTVRAGRVGRADARVSVRTCTITFARAFLRQAADGGRPRSRAWASAWCLLTVHEYGHLVGRTHRDPDPVMRPVIDTAVARVPECRKLAAGFR